MVKQKSPRKRGLYKKIEKMEILAKQPNPTMQEQLDDIIIDVSWGRLAKEYFGKSSSWIYNKMKGIDGNGGHGEFSPEEKEILKGALVDIADRIRHAANNIQ